MNRVKFSALMVTRPGIHNKRFMGPWFGVIAGGTGDRPPPRSRTAATFNFKHVQNIDVIIFKHCIWIIFISRRNLFLRFITFRSFETQHRELHCVFEIFLLFGWIQTLFFRNIFSFSNELCLTRAVHCFYSIVHLIFQDLFTFHCWSTSRNKSFRNSILRWYHLDKKFC